MKKRQIFFIIVIAVLLTEIINIFFGSFFSAKISTWSFVKKHDLLRPNAPIVIHTTEQVRVSDTQDTLVAYNKAKSKVSAVLFVDGEKTQVLTTAINISGDGVFMASKTVLANIPVEKLAIKTYSGDVAKVKTMVVDAASNIAMLQAPFKNVPPASFADSVSVTSGTRLIQLAAIDTGDPLFYAGFAAGNEKISGTVNATTSNRSLAVDFHATVGHIVVNLDGDIVGLGDGSVIIPADVLKNVSANYFAHGGNILRASFGFYYTPLSQAISTLRSLPVGVEVVRLGDTPQAVTASPAGKAGLKVGDVIVNVNGQAVSESTDVELALEKVSPGQTVALQVKRGSTDASVQFVASELK